MTGPDYNRAVLQVEAFTTTLRLRRGTPPPKPWNVVWNEPATAEQAADAVLAAKGWARTGEWEPLFAAPRDVPIGSVVGAYHAPVERITGLE